jgi:hypothetical protein
MTTKLLAVAFTSSLLTATALASAGAADMTQERALNPQREPQNTAITRAIDSLCSLTSTPKR